MEHEKKIEQTNEMGTSKVAGDFVEFLEESFSKLSIGTHLGKYKMVCHLYLSISRFLRISG
jgi:hypothetical protein